MVKYSQTIQKKKEKKKKKTKLWITQFRNSKFNKKKIHTKKNKKTKKNYEVEYQAFVMDTISTDEIEMDERTQENKETINERNEKNNEKDESENYNENEKMLGLTLKQFHNINYTNHQCIIKCYGLTLTPYDLSPTFELETEAFQFRVLHVCVLILFLFFWFFFPSLVSVYIDSVLSYMYCVCVCKNYFNVWFYV